VWKLLAAFVGVLYVGLTTSHAEQPDRPLAGKVCRGTYRIDHAGPSENDWGGYQYRFFMKGDVLAVRWWSGRGRVTYEKFAAEVAKKHLTDEVAWLQDLGEVSPVAIDGRHVNMTSPMGALLTLEFDGEYLEGTVDPRKIPGRESWVVAKVKLLCRNAE
jgi:hypothetical protein